jgi:hypothetical protein
LTAEIKRKKTARHRHQPNRGKGGEEEAEERETLIEMGKLLCDPSAAAVAEALPPSPAPAPPPPLLAWSSPAPASSPEASISPTGWDAVWALEDQQRRRLHRIWERGVAWKPSSPGAGEAALPPVVFRLDHGGEVDADGNCLFTAARTAAAAKADARELRHRAVRRFAEVYAAAGEDDKNAVDAAVRHLYAPDLKAGWGVHVVQEIKVLVPKAQRHALDSAIQELVDLGIQRYRARGSALARCSSSNLLIFSPLQDLKALSFFSVCLFDDFAILALGLIRRSCNVVFSPPSK